MSEAVITTTQQADTTTYTATIDGIEAAELVIWTDRREVANIATEPAYRRQGHALALWEAANADGECFHALDHHRTEEGDAFAEAVGGDTIDDEAGHQDACGICNGDLDYEDEEY